MQNTIHKLKKPILTLLIQKATNKRELIIFVTVLAGMLIHWLIALNNHQILAMTASAIKWASGYDDNLYYLTNYTVGFIKSFLILLLCSYAIAATDSLRLVYGLSTFIAVSMGLDLINLISTDMYYLVKPYRYTVTYNFKDIYAAFEITCLLLSVARVGMDVIKATFNYYSDRHDALFHSFVSNHSFEKN